MAYRVPATTGAAVAKPTGTNERTVGTLDAGTLLLARTVLPGTPPETSRISMLTGAVGVPNLWRFRSTRSTPPLRPAEKVWARLPFEAMA
jgi:hypothetical protein